MFIILFKPGAQLFALHDTEKLILGFLLVMATFMYGLSNNVTKRFLQEVPALAIASFAYTCMSIPAAIYLFSGTDFSVKISIGKDAYWALGYIFILAAVGSALAMYLFNKLIKNSSALVASFVTYFIPVVAMLWGIIDGETLQFIQILGLAVILSGVYIVSIKK